MGNLADAKISWWYGVVDGFGQTGIVADFEVGGGVHVLLLSAGNDISHDYW